MSLLALNDVNVTTEAAGRQIDVLRDVSLAIGRGELVGVVGESGAGKSMVGRLIAGMLPRGFAASRGSVTFLDRDLFAMAPRERTGLLGDAIAFVPQHPMTSLNPVLSLGAQFDEHLKRLGQDGKAARRERAVAALDSVHLPRPADLLARFPHQLSGGQCQRALIAMAFAGKPDLIIADEPTTALDVITQARVMKLIDELQRDSETGLLFITHDLRLAAQHCQRIAVMYAGEIVETGPAAALLGDPLHPYTRSLVAANPGIGGPVRRLTALPDHMPGLSGFADLPGCRFAPRCPVRDEACAAARSSLVEVAPGRFVRSAGACREAASAAAGQGGLPDAEIAAAAPILSVSGLGKTFRSGRDWLGRRRAPVVAVDGVNLEIAPGEFVGLVGESGSGKSTVARLLLGLETPDDGRIVVDGQDITGPFQRTAKQRIALIQMIFQDPQSALNPRQRIGRLVTQSMEVRRPPASWPERLERARDLLGQTGLPQDTIGRFPVQVSGGQRQRVNIARALCTAPKVLVADEIVSGLDVSVQAQILNLLLDMRAQRQISMLFISHDLSVVRYLCSRVAIMNRGRIVEQGPTEDVFRAPQHEYTKALLAAVP